MKVSIITVYYNRENYVTESIKSLLNQSYGNIEVIAVDDGSTDNTLNKLQEIKDTRLNVISHSNRGFVRSIIKAVDHSSGDIIAIHGSGDISFEDRIEKQLNVLKNNNNIGVVGCWVENVNTVTGEHRINKPMVYEGENITSKLFRGNIFTHGEMMFRKSVYYKVDGYRPFFKFSQDYDLWIRMSLVTQFSVVQEILYRRYTLPGGVNASFEKRTLQRYFGEISRQCIDMKIKTGEDLIDKHGYYAPFFMKRTKRLSYFLFRLAIQAFRLNKLESAKAINRLSIKERKRTYNIAFSLVIWVSKRNSLFKHIFDELYLFLRKLVKGK